MWSSRISLSLPQTANVMAKCRGIDHSTDDLMNSPISWLRLSRTLQLIFIDCKSKYFHEMIVNSPAHYASSTIVNKRALDMALLDSRFWIRLFEDMKVIKTLLANMNIPQYWMVRKCLCAFEVAIILSAATCNGLIPVPAQLCNLLPESSTPTLAQRIPSCSSPSFSISAPCFALCQRHQCSSSSVALSRAWEARAWRMGH